MKMQVGMFFWLWLSMGCTKKKNNSSLMKNSQDKSKEQKEESVTSGTIVSGVFRDIAFPLVGEISEDWDVIPQDHRGTRRFRAKHKQMDVFVEIWSFPDTLIEPPIHDFCTWGFVDRGFYENTQSRVIRSTCIPNVRTKPHVFAEIHHWKGGTWLLEVHSSAESILSGKKKGEDFLQGFTWNDGTIQ